MAPTTTPCATLPTPEQDNEQVSHETAQSVVHHAACGPEQIDRRLEELNKELEIEHTADTTSQPQRSVADISDERCALKALRGDFRDVPPLTTAEERDELARFEGEGGRASDHDEEDALDRRDRAAVAKALQAARR